jgi:3-oxoadipate enol-lactonase
MVFVHPNPMDRSSWLFQVAHFSTWFRCVAVDLPGYGRSPSAHGQLSMPGIAEAVWESVDRAGAGEQQAVLVGCSIGSSVAQHMYHRRPERTAALVVCGTGWWRRKDFAGRHIRAYREQGLAYRREFTLNGFSPDFRRTALAEWFASLFMERNGAADLDTIIALLEAHSKPDPDWLQADLRAPVLIISGSEDASHPAAHRLVDRLPEAELVTIKGAGHACHIEQPRAFDRAVIDFLDRHGVRSSPPP